MTLALPRLGIDSLAIAALLCRSLVGSATAQVATLSESAPGSEASAALLAEDLDGEEALLEWASCLRDNDIDIDDPQFGASAGRFGFGLGNGVGEAGFDPQSAEFRAATDACGNVLETLRPDIDPEEEAERAEQQLVIAECMRELGWEFPDPASDAGFRAQIRFIEDAGIDPGDPAFRTDIGT